jgi:hypothetical protein
VIEGEGSDSIDPSQRLQDLAVQHGGSSLMLAFERPNSAQWRDVSWQARMAGHQILTDEAVSGEFVFPVADSGDGGKIVAPMAQNDDVDGDGEPDEDILVTGDSTENDFSPPTGGEGGAGGVGSGGGNEFSPDNGGGGGEIVAEETPCVEAAPSSVSLQDLNNKALTESIAISNRNDETFEYGVILYLKDGVLHSTGVFGGQYTDRVDWNLGIPLVPDGAIIVATLHNHPNENNVNDTIPSMDTMRNPGGTDWLAYDSFLTIAQRNTRGITADPNMLMYIYTNEDMKTRVYDKTERNTTQTSCSLQS